MTWLANGPVPIQSRFQISLLSCISGEGRNRDFFSWYVSYCVIIYGVAIDINAWTPTFFSFWSSSCSCSFLVNCTTIPTVAFILPTPCLRPNHIYKRRVFYSC
ncbi:hypothetical protein B0T17DRAFT_9643 [Bombardia bombarda]|uniref:Uncharacterized protein n=1 Tax=Bombardia bombarda TaxID=252184 RepID=A0AA40CDL5_9PEZI|nr:hypothetical protein B0T17DRAFT_9643 [Bombardia bombarda]